jgi:anti-anti-sigma regulatory factor
MSYGKILTRKYPMESLIILTLEGDFQNPEQIVSTVKPCLGAFKSIVFDVKHINYINSSCFGSFFELASGMKGKQSQFFFMNPNKKFNIIYQVLGAANIFRVINNLDEIREKK